MANETFKPGDVVRLKSGSESMTVSKQSKVEGAEHVWCTWYDGKKIVNSDFPAATLEMYDPQDLLG